MEKRKEENKLTSMQFRGKRKGKFVPLMAVSPGKQNLSNCALLFGGWEGLGGG